MSCTACCFFFLLPLLLAPQTHCQFNNNKTKIYFSSQVATACSPPSATFHANWTLTAGKKNCGNQGKIIKKALKEHNGSSPGNGALWRRCNPLGGQRMSQEFPNPLSSRSTHQSSGWGSFPRRAGGLVFAATQLSLRDGRGCEDVRFIHILRM